MANRAKKLTGQEELRGGPVSGATLLDFWQWAFSDLQMNDTRGILAEWIVMKLLGIDSAQIPLRDSWGDSDLRTPEGVSIEVKTSGYAQSWSETANSKIRFTGLNGRTWSAEDGFGEEPDYKAQLYVFCVQIEKDLTRWDALDLGQWRFYIAPREKLVAHGGESISLSTLQTIARELTADEFQQEAARHLQALVPVPSSQNPLGDVQRGN